MARRISLYCLCWNEAKIIPFFLRHYLPLVDQIIVYDNGSTDGSLSLLAGDPRIDVRGFVTTGDSFVDLERGLSDVIWHESRDRDDWVILLDMDEHLHHPDLLAYLAACKANGITAIRAIGYEMVAPAFPDDTGLLRDRVLKGVRSPGHDKVCVFNPNAIQETRFTIGRHDAAPVGRVFWPIRREVTLLHYKNLGAAYVAGRNTVLREGLRALDLKMGWGRHYLRSEAEVLKEFAWLSAHAEPVPGLHGSARTPSQICADEEILRESGLFLTDWYAQTYPDVANAGIDPLMHYHAVGWREGRRPNPHFDPSWYAATYAPGLDVADPLLDYVKYGERNGRRPSPHFDPTSYRKHNAVQAQDSPLRHFLQRISAGGGAVAV